MLLYPGRTHGESCKKQGDRRSSREAAKQVQERLTGLEAVVTKTRLQNSKTHAKPKARSLNLLGFLTGTASIG